MTLDFQPNIKDPCRTWWITKLLLDLPGSSYICLLLWVNSTSHFWLFNNLPFLYFLSFNKYFFDLNFSQHISAIWSSICLLFILFCLIFYFNFEIFNPSCNISKSSFMITWSSSILFVIFYVFCSMFSFELMSETFKI